jgi:hypothetical protein
MTSFAPLARLAVVLGGALALQACGAAEDTPKPTDTSGAVALDGDHAFSVTFDAGPCPALDCGAVRRFDRATGLSTILARVDGIGGNLALDEDSVYFVSTTGPLFAEGGPSDTTGTVTTIGRVAKVGGPSTVIATLPHSAVQGLVVRGGSVIFTVSGRRCIRSIAELVERAEGGGAIAVLGTTTTTTTNSGAVTQVVADDAFVYWALRSYGEKDAFLIRRTPLSGETEPMIFARGDGWLVGMALDDSGLYVTNHGARSTDATSFDATDGSVIAISLAGT